MRARVVAGNVGQLVRFLSYAFLVPIVVAFLFESQRPGSTIAGVFVPTSAFVFLVAFLVALVLAFFLEAFARAGDLRDHEAFVTVGASWVLISALGAIPYVLSGVLANPLDAFFESLSGFTTVGATVLPAASTLGGLDWTDLYPESILFWRSFSQWLGGMGVIVLAVAVLPRLVATGASLVRAEGATAERVRPTVVKTARAFWGIYLLLTAAGAASLFLVLSIEKGLSPPRAAYDAVVHAMTSIATGGFTPSAGSVAALQSGAAEAVILVLMLLGGIGFAAHFHLLRGNPRRWIGDREIRFFLGMLATGFAITFAMLFARGTDAAWQAFGGNVFDAARHVAFTVVSLQTTTGFASTNHDLLPDGARLILVPLMLAGGCLGSTAGGIKTLRILVLLQAIRYEIYQTIHPRGRAPMRVKDVVIDDPTLRSILAFLAAFLAAYVVSVVLLSLLGFDVMAALSAPAATLAGVGPAMGSVVGGPDFTYATIHPLAKVVLSFNMLLGRLEIFAVLLLFTPSTYRA
ncbi:MAG TPA: TrkH family potassium uptake protein [Candidatus Thermoplasmatota archaeon]|nr:TrkH family potassium uptake protein [Candidatus Thermoplasmatota archaeon]